MNKKWIQVGYGIGMTLILTGILYFFASNWQGFERHTKLFLSGGITLLFYVSVFLFSTYFRHQKFFIRTLWIAASISFGLSLALIGQLYNSHADHYLLFLVWLIPTLSLSIFIRHQSFYILSYSLFHLSVYFYFFSSSSFGVVGKESLFFLYGIIGVINLGLFYCFKRKWMVSSVLMYVSLTFSHLLFILMTISDTFGLWGLIGNIGYLFLFVSQFYFYYKKEHHIKILSLLSVLAALFLLLKGIELVDEFFALGFLFLLLFIVSLLLFGGIKLTNLLKKHNGHSRLKHMMIASITFLCSILLTIAIIGIISLIMGDIAYFILFLFAIAFLLIPAFLYDGWNSTLRFTLITTGYLIAVCATVFDSSYLLYYLVLFAVLLFGYFKLSSSGMKVLQYMLFNGLLVMFLFTHVTDKEKIVIGILGIINALISSKSFSYRPRSIQQTSFVLFMSSFFIMTRFDFNSLVYLLIINVMFFFTLFTLLFIESKKKRKTEFWSSIGFGMMYLCALYYDYAWNLFNKSFVFMIVGILLFIVSFYFDEHKKQTKQPLFTRKNTVILFVVFLQFGIIGTQIGRNEHLLQTGTKINLSLMPVDPRSLMQGDYVQLNYEISRIDELQYHEFKPKEHIKVVLRANEKGIYEYSGYYFAKDHWNKSYKKEPGDVIINGKSDGWKSVSYGIEHYFIPEKTGQEIERKTKYATVRVSKNGNAIIISLSPRLE